MKTFLNVGCGPTRSKIKGFDNGDWKEFGLILMRM